MSKLTLDKYVLGSIKDRPRSMYDLGRAIALFVPDDHELSRSVGAFLVAANMTEEKHHAGIFIQMMNEMNDVFPENVIESGEAPWWMAVVCMLMSGGTPECQDLHEQLTERFKPKEDTVDEPS